MNGWFNFDGIGPNEVGNVSSGNRGNLVVLVSHNISSLSFFFSVSSKIHSITKYLPIYVGVGTYSVVPKVPR